MDRHDSREKAYRRISSCWQTDQTRPLYLQPRNTPCITSKALLPPGWIIIICNKNTLLFCHYRRSIRALYNIPPEHNAEHIIIIITTNNYPLHPLFHYRDELHCLCSSLIICLFIPIKTLHNLDFHVHSDHEHYRGAKTSWPPWFYSQCPADICRVQDYYFRLSSIMALVPFQLRASMVAFHSRMLSDSVWALYPPSETNYPG